VACVSSGTVAYSHAVGWLMTAAYRSKERGLACDGGKDI
jgi:hypothetical protein